MKPRIAHTLPTKPRDEEAGLSRRNWFRTRNWRVVGHFSIGWRKPSRNFQRKEAVYVLQSLETRRNRARSSGTAPLLAQRTRQKWGSHILTGWLLIAEGIKCVTVFANESASGWTRGSGSDSGSGWVEGHCREKCPPARRETSPCLHRERRSEEPISVPSRVEHRRSRDCQTGKN